MSRNFSPTKYFRAMAVEHQPRWRFAGANETDWRQWHAELRSKVLGTLGVLPEKVPLRAEVQAEWVEDGLFKQRIVFDVERHLSTPCYVYRPQHAKGPLPAILACHGHGPTGKDLVMGNRGSEEGRPVIDALNYAYGLEMAKAGFVTIAIDWRGFGERSDRRKPNGAAQHDARDECNLNYLRATLLGMTALGMNIHDGKCALDYLCEQPFVDPRRIGVMGLSFGGTMATWMAIADDRIKAADVICYSDRFADFAMRDHNSCGSQIAPSLFALCDVPDLHGLIAPRPLLVEIGAFDDVFMVDSAMSCFHEVEKIYASAGVRDRLELDLFEGGHRWSGRKSVEFFRTHLGTTD